MSIQNEKVLKAIKEHLESTGNDYTVINNKILAEKTGLNVNEIFEAKKELMKNGELFIHKGIEKPSIDMNMKIKKCRKK